MESITQKNGFMILLKRQVIFNLLKENNIWAFAIERGETAGKNQIYFYIYAKYVF